MYDFNQDLYTAIKKNVKYFLAGKELIDVAAFNLNIERNINFDILRRKKYNLFQLEIPTPTIIPEIPIPTIPNEIPNPQPSTPEIPNPDVTPEKPTPAPDPAKPEIPNPEPSKPEIPGPPNTPEKPAK